MAPIELRTLTAHVARLVLIASVVAACATPPGNVGKDGTTSLQAGEASPSAGNSEAGPTPDVAGTAGATGGPSRATDAWTAGSDDASAAATTGTPATSAPGTAAPAIPTPSTPAPSTHAPAGPTAPPAPAATSAPATPMPAPTPRPLSACPVLPASNVWNRRVDGLPVAASSDAMIAAIGAGSSLHPDFSNAGGYGIPFNIVGTATPRSAVTFQYADESDAGPYPIPASARIEGGSDRHVLLVDTDACVLHELYAAVQASAGWTAGSGAIWNLGSNALRPAGWTSADAAGLPIFPGLVRYAEVAAGLVDHAIRFTAPATCAGYVYPARHQAGSGSCASKPPMGLRIRLKASVDISAFGPQSRVILVALQRYGMLLADNGSPWYITGAPDSRWNDDELHGLGALKGSDFEVVDTAGMVNG